MNILDKIIAAKKKVLAEKKEIMSLDVRRFLTSDLERKCYSLKEALTQYDSSGIIAEFKRKSPSKGWLNENIRVSEVVPFYESNGASGISVLTEKNFFGGEINELKIARLQVQVPLIRKDFIIDEFQLYEAKSYGADVVLLIAACLTKQKVKQLAKKAKELGMEVLLELHAPHESDYICDHIDIVGINNRDLQTFETNIQTSIDMIGLMPAGKPVISESGISDVDTIVSLREVGFRGFLLGEVFMKEPHPAIAFAGFMKQLKAKIK